jgi:hypothetical protein
MVLLTKPLRPGQSVVGAQLAISMIGPLLPCAIGKDTGLLAPKNLMRGGI